MVKRQQKILLFLVKLVTYKYTKTEALDPVTNQVVSLFHPRQMNWDDHFCWNADAMKMLGVRPSGRATIDLLQTNRNGVINMRRVLTIVNEHPPD